MIEWAESIARIEKAKKCIQTCWLNTQSRRWEDNSKSEIRGRGCGCLDVIQLAQDDFHRKVWSEHITESPGSGKPRSLIS